MDKIVVTGGAGFAGSHIVDQICREFPEAEVTVFDRMTYAGDVRNIAHHLMHQRIRLIVGDVAHLDGCRRAIRGASLVIHAAAESHVDNSFGNSLEFTRTNVLGTHSLLEACRQERVPRIVHVSTDEVYGEVITGAADENSLLRPTNPYSSSKAAAEMIIRGYVQSYQAPILTVRANNLYGIRQYPEKIIPRFVCHMLLGLPLPLHGNGLNRRHYLSAVDFAGAIALLSRSGQVGETYNIGTLEEYTNLEVASMIARQFDKKFEDVVHFVPNRPFNDARYSISWEKLATMGWKPKYRLADDLSQIADWYVQQLPRYSELFAEALPRIATREDSASSLLQSQMRQTIGLVPMDAPSSLVV